MSYEKVKSVKIDLNENKVYITSACNNVRPLNYEKWESPTLSKILKERGLRAVETEILKTYEEGSFQSAKTNKYEKAKMVLMVLFKEEYNKYSWNIWGESDEQRKIRSDLRDSKEFKVLLRKCLDYKGNNYKWIITKEVWGEIAFARMCPTCCKWTRDKSKATKYDFKEIAKDSIYAKYKDEWKVVKL